MANAAPTGSIGLSNQGKMQLKASSMRDQSVQSLGEYFPFVQYHEKVEPTSTLSFLSVCQYQQNGQKYYEFTLKDSLEKREFVLRSDQSAKNQKYSFVGYDAGTKVLLLQNNATGKRVSVRQIEQKPVTNLRERGNVSSSGSYNTPWNTDEFPSWED